jgi:hypothetical protein
LTPNRIKSGFFSGRDVGCRARFFIVRLTGFGLPG